MNSVLFEFFIQLIELLLVLLNFIMGELGLGKQIFREPYNETDL
jgi:hypothetical protein